MSLLRIVMASALIAAAGGPLASATSAAAPGSVSVVASGLNNPRGLAFAKGQLYVAEAGSGGSDCPKGATGAEGGPLCAGLTGALATISLGAVHVRMGGLFSFSDIPGGSAAEGIAAVAATGRGLELLRGESVLGLLTSLPAGSRFNEADSAAARRELGRLSSLGASGGRVLADVGDEDFAWTGINQNLVPEQYPDSNPNALAVVGSTTYVADAGANQLVSVDAHGVVRQLAFFPNPPARDAVPTCVAAGPHGNLYIGELAPGAKPGEGAIYRYGIASHRLSLWKSGFNVVDGCGFDHKGNFYAVEFQAHGFNPSPTGNPAGDIVEIAKNGTRSVLGEGQLFYPQGFAVDAKDNIYVSNWSILTGTPRGPGAPTGEVVKIRH